MPQPSTNLARSLVLPNGRPGAIDSEWFLTVIAREEGESVVQPACGRFTAGVPGCEVVRNPGRLEGLTQGSGEGASAQGKQQTAVCFACLQVNDVDDSNKTALFVASQHCDAAAVRLLLDHGAAPNWIPEPDEEECPQNLLYDFALHPEPEGCGNGEFKTKVWPVWGELQRGGAAFDEQNDCDYPGGVLLKGK